MEYRNRRKSWSWALGLTTLICMLLVGCLGLATAESQLSPLTLTLVDDNKTVTSTVTTSGSADISWEKDSTRSKSYQLTIDAQLPAGVIHPQLIISLAEGMRFENDAADLSERVTLVGSQPNTVPAGYADANAGNDFKNTGTRTYDIQENITTFTETISIAQHELFRFANINNAINVTMTYQQNGQTVTKTATMHVNSINLINGVDQRAQMVAIERGQTVNFSLAQGDVVSYNIAASSYLFRLGNRIQPNSRNDTCRQLVKKITVTIASDNPSFITTQLLSNADGWKKVNNPAGLQNAVATYEVEIMGVVDSDICPVEIYYTKSNTSPVKVYLTYNTEYYANDEASTASDSHTLNFYYKPNGEKLYINWWYTNAVTAVGNNWLWGGESDTLYMGANSGAGHRTEPLGVFRFGNVGAADSSPKYIEVDFSAAKGRIGVTHLIMDGIDKGDAVTVYYKTTTQTNDEWQTTTLNTNSLGSGWYDREHFSITVDPTTNEPYILAVKFPIVIPSGAADYYVRYNGSVLEESPEKLSVMAKIYNRGSEWNQATDPYAYTVSLKGTEPKAAELGITNMPTTQTVTAGQQIHLSATLGPANTSWMCQVPERIIYLISDKGLPFVSDSLKIYSGAYNTYLQEGVDYTIETGKDVFKDGGSAVPYIKIMMKDTPLSVPGEVLMRRGTEKVDQLYNDFQLSWALQTDSTTESMTGSCADSLLVDLPYGDGSANLTIASCEKVTNAGNIVSATPHGALYKPVTSGTYEVVGLEGVGVVLNAKRTKDSDYQAATADTTPVISVGAVGSSAANTMDIKLVAVNNNAHALTQSAAIYFPIPKKGQTWEVLKGNSPFAFDMQLASAVTATSSAGNMSYQVLYSTSTELLNKNYDQLQADTSFSATPPADLSSVTCLKLMTAPNLPVKATQDFSFRMLGSHADVTGVDALHAVYYQVADTFTGWTSSYPVQAAAMSGALSGSLFADTYPLNGLKGDTETVPSNVTSWTISVLDRNNSDATVATTTPGTNGSFSFDMLAYDSVGSRYRLKVTNPTSDKSWYFAPVAQGGNVVVASSDHATAQTANDFALKTDGSTTYLVGVVENTEGNKTTVTFTTDSTYGTIQYADSNTTSWSQTGIYADLLTVPTVNTTSGVPHIVENPGYTFAYWADANNADASAALQNATLGVENRTYTAVWTPNTGFSVVYDTAGGTPEIPTKTNVIWTDVNLLPETTVTRDGYTFLGWFSGTVQVSNTTTYAALAGNNDTPGSSVTLTAKWRKNAAAGSEDISSANAFALMTVNLTGINPPATNAEKFAFTILPQDNAPAPSVQTVYVSTLAAGTDTNTCYGLSVEHAVQVGFGSVEFTEPNTYRYTIQQTIPTDADKKHGYTYDSTICTLTVTATGVNNGGEDTLALTYATEPATGLAFTNNYLPASVGGDDTLPLVQKEVTGNPTQMLGFTFILTPVSAVDENGDEIMAPEQMPVPATTTLTLNRTSEPQSFGSIAYARPGIYTYTITEDIPNTPYAGYTYDKTVYTIVDTVTDDNGANKLTLRVVKKGSDTLPDEETKVLTFTNSFDPTVMVNYFLTENDTKAWKTIATTWTSAGLIPSEAPTREGYTFLHWYFKDASGSKHEVTDATLYSDLAIQDDMLDISLYALWRKNAVFGGGTSGDGSTGGGTSGDGSTGGGTSGDGSTGGGTSGDESDPNGLGSKLGLVHKTLTGNTPPKEVDANFAFTITAGTYTAPSGSTINTTVPMPKMTTAYVSTSAGTNTANKTFGLSTTAPKDVRFGSIAFTQPGTYTYTIKEKAGSDPHYIYDSTIYTMTVVLAEKEDASGDLFLQLQSVQYTAAGAGNKASLDVAEFTNKYSAEVATAPVLKVEHVIDGSWNEETAFQFQLVPVSSDGGEQPPMPENSTVTIQGQGIAAFDQWTYHTPGTFTYTVKALPASVPGLVTDMREYTVIDTVKDKAGSLIVSRTIKGLASGQDMIMFTTTAPVKLPATGDGSTPILWLALMLMSFAGIFLVARKKKA